MKFRFDCFHLIRGRACEEAGKTVSRYQVRRPQKSLPRQRDMLRVVNLQIQCSSQAFRMQFAA